VQSHCKLFIVTLWIFPPEKKRKMIFIQYSLLFTCRNKFVVGFVPTGMLCGYHCSMPMGAKPTTAVSKFWCVYVPTTWFQNPLLVAFLFVYCFYLLWLKISKIYILLKDWFVYLFCNHLLAACHWTACVVHSSIVITTGNLQVLMCGPIDTRCTGMNVKVRKTWNKDQVPWEKH